MTAPHRHLVLVMVLLAGAVHAADNAAAPDNEFKRLAEMVHRSAPSQEVIDTLYTFMEKWPKDARSDQVQFWVGQVQQKRKFHNEAIKEFGFVVQEFPQSRLVMPALQAQARSYLAMDKRREAAECFAAMVERKPADFKADPTATKLFREAAIWLAEQAMRGKKPRADEAIALLAQLPDQRESVSRIVEVYVAVERFEDAMKTIRRLDESDRVLMYQLLTRLYAARPGTGNLFALLDRLFADEKPGKPVDELVRNVVGAIGSKAGADRHKALERVVAKYDRLKRWAAYSLCDMDKSTDLPRLVTFVGDYRSGGDVEQCKRWIGAFYESANEPAKARDAYGQLDDKVAGHFLIAETYYGPRAKKPDLKGGEQELIEIVKRFYSKAVCCEALMRRADLQASRMKNPDAALASLRELVDRFGAEGEWPVRSLMRQGQILRGQKKQDEAILAYEQVILKYSKHGAVRQAWLEIAACHEEKNDRQRAIETYRTVLRKFPRTSEASRAHTVLETKYKIADTDVSDR